MNIPKGKHYCPVIVMSNVTLLKQLIHLKQTSQHDQCNDCIYGKEGVFLNVQITY